MKKKIFSILAAVCCSVGLMAQDTPDYLSFTATGGSVTLSMAKQNLPSTTPTLETSLDKTVWTAFTPGTTSVEISAGSTLYMRNSGDSPISSGSSTSAYWHFTMTGDGTIALGGNMMSLLDKTCESTAITGNYALMGLFDGCTKITSVPATGFLPATALKVFCYAYMFRGCSSLQNAPELPCTDVGQKMYAYMFSGCSSLQTAPALPATKVGSQSYQEMFKGCTTLTTAPALPATTLGTDCYKDMFNGCTNLVNAPVLSVTALKQGCYHSMFEGCINLENAPALPATTPSTECYQAMFKGCTSLVNAPEIKLTSLAKNTCTEMFAGCTSLQYVKANFNTFNTLEVDYTTNWLPNEEGNNGATFVGQKGLAVTAEGNRTTSTVPDKWTISTDYIPFVFNAGTDYFNAQKTLLEGVVAGTPVAQVVQITGRPYKAGMWNSICLPFAMTAEQIAATFGTGTKVGTLTRGETINEELILDFNTTVTAMEAGVPYIIYPGSNTDISDAVKYNDVTITVSAPQNYTVDDVQFFGAFGTLWGNYDEYPQNSYGLAENNTIYEINHETKLSGFRSIFVWTKSGAAPAPKRVRLIINGEQTATNLGEMTISAQATKMIENGQVVIIKNGVKYNMFGQKL